MRGSKTKLQKRNDEFHITIYLPFAVPRIYENQQGYDGRKPTRQVLRLSEQPLRKTYALDPGQHNIVYTENRVDQHLWAGFRYLSKCKGAKGLVQRKNEGMGQG